MLPFKWPFCGRVSLYLILLVGILRLGVFDGDQFIYVQF